MRAPPPFDVVEPTGPETPVVVEVPHAGLEVAAQFVEPLCAPCSALARDADLYVDDLYADAPAEGATLVVARASRYVIDLNRGESDIDAEAVEGGRGDVRLHHGLVWRTTSDGQPALARTLARAELDERLEAVWRPYHRALAAVVAGKVERFGVAVIVAAHSMPTAGPRPGAAVRADVVPGTRSRTSADARFIDALEALARARDWTVRHDDPYAGGYTTQHYGRPAKGTHVVQVELSRRLYLDERTLRALPALASVRGWCRQLVARFGQIATQLAVERGARGERDA